MVAVIRAMTINRNNAWQNTIKKSRTKLHGIQLLESSIPEDVLDELAGSLQSRTPLIQILQIITPQIMWELTGHPASEF